VVSFKGETFEVPIGYIQETILLFENSLDSTLFMNHEGKRILLHAVDLTANAADRRTKKVVKPPQKMDFDAKSASQLEYEEVMAPIITSDGGFTTPEKEAP
jgi:hypothetical protein